ncbi:MAG: glycosyltransferase [Candidatus Nealsonbacteria bacterium]|nr:glycosyltransferase [Candidatus Nealsonbacteria bacterium]
MKILLANINDLQPIPPPEDLIRADTYVSVPLALGLKKMGHDVFFLCPKDSKIGVKKIFTSTKSLHSIISLEEFLGISNSNLRTEMILSLQFDLYLNLIEACKREKFDLVHIHTNNPLAELIISKKIKTPFFFTLHGICLYPELESRIKRLFSKKENYFISISDYQRKTYPGMKFLDTVYNGLQLEKFPFVERGGERMFFAGRLKKNKGVKEAVEIAQKTAKRLEITGSVSTDPADRAYFVDDLMKEIKKSKGMISYRGLVRRREMAAFYGQSRLTLFPVQWEEPFGLVMTESMATGTPVVGFARGSVPEVIKDGKTGFIVNPSAKDIRGNWIIKKTGIAGMIEAVNRIYDLPEKDYLAMRENCRRRVEENFSAEKMVNSYESLYRQIVRN